MVDAVFLIVPSLRVTGQMQMLHVLGDPVAPSAQVLVGALAVIRILEVQTINARPVSHLSAIIYLNNISSHRND